MEAYLLPAASPLAAKLASLVTAKPEGFRWLHVLFPPALLSQGLPTLRPMDKQLALFLEGSF